MENPETKIERFELLVGRLEGAAALANGEQEHCDAREAVMAAFRSVQTSSPQEESRMTFDPERKDWHVLIHTYGGAVSLIQNLTLHTAREVVLRTPKAHIEGYATGSPHGGVGRWTTTNPPSDIRSISIIGPEGWEQGTAKP